MSIQTISDSKQFCFTPISAAGVLLFLAACGDVDPNEYYEKTGHLHDNSSDTEPAHIDSQGRDTAPDTETEGDDCTNVDWGFGCKTDAPTYNITFEGLDVAAEKEETISLEKLYCMGYESVLIIAGDAMCSACPIWYEAVGAYTKELHAADTAVVSACTDNFGRDALSVVTALSVTADINPDFVTGDNPFKYPCRYDFTPFSMVIDLSNATILGKDSVNHKLSMTEILSLVEDAKGK